MHRYEPKTSILTRIVIGLIVFAAFGLFGALISLMSVDAGRSLALQAFVFGSSAALLFYIFRAVLQSQRIHRTPSPLISLDPKHPKSEADDATTTPNAADEKGDEVPSDTPSPPVDTR